MPLESDKKQRLNSHKCTVTLYNTKPCLPHIQVPTEGREEISIGRSSKSDVRISGGDVSGLHCKLQFTRLNTAQLVIAVVDTSSNGTYINQEKLQKGIAKIIRSGDTVSFAKSGGSYILRYSDADYEDDGNNTSEKKLVPIKKQSFFDFYILGGQLGSGHYAVVKEAKDRRSGDSVAVKIFHASKTNKTTSNDHNAKLLQEMELLLAVQHPNIVKFINHFQEPISPTMSTSYLVLEKVNGGELFQRIVSKGKLRQNETKELFRQLLGGLNYLHSRNIIHRDIKPENILLDIKRRTTPDQIANGPWDEDELDVQVKIADFGLAKFIGELKFTNTLCGTPAYVAPEILSDKRNYSTKVDTWLSGVLLYVCLCGFPPFSEELGPPTMKEQILTAKYAFYSPYWDEIDDLVLDLIQNLLKVDPDKRYDYSQALKHPWFFNDYTTESDKDEDYDEIDMDIERPKIEKQPTTLQQEYSMI